MNKQPEALRLADLFEVADKNTPGGDKGWLAVAAELRRLHEENEGLRKAYRKMYNAAAGYSNYCEDSASVRRCERDFDEADAMFRTAIAKVTGEQP